MNYNLFFGRNIPTGGTVTNEEIDWFLTNHVDSRFDGYTIQHVQGVWKGQREDTMLLTIETDDENKLRELTTVYKNVFHQDAVGMMQVPTMQFV